MYKTLLVLIVVLLLATDHLRAEEQKNEVFLRQYLTMPSPSSCTLISSRDHERGKLFDVAFSSQVWRDITWTHRLKFIVPRKVRDGGYVYLLIFGSGSEVAELEEAAAVVAETGIPAAILGDVPNQPLFERKEDALLAFTFHRFLDTGDNSWPILAPMVKSVVRAMDCLTNIVPNFSHSPLKKFIVSGSSKRGWTTWLSGLVDQRVAAIAPRVFDMLNMEAQISWAKQTYGAPSEKIADYTDLGITERLGEPRAQQLLRGVDPFYYLQRKDMATLVLLGANDPYWVIDATRLYWRDVNKPKVLSVLPQGGHHISGDPVIRESLVAWVRAVAEGTAPHGFEYVERVTREKKVCAKVGDKAKGVKLWYSKAPHHDFRSAVWLERPVELQITASGREPIFCGNLPAACDSAYCGYFMEAKILGGRLTVSTPPQVLAPASVGSGVILGE